MARKSKALIVGISGVSSSGKTTLARLLRDIFPRTFILHEDDFYKRDADIPINHFAGGVADWDCAEAINLPAFKDALEFIKQNGVLPPDLVSKEDKNDVGNVDIDAGVMDDLTRKARRWMTQDAPPIAIIDGFLMYSEDMKSIRNLLDVKLFLKTDFATVKSRREMRNGYVTIEGFWSDPPLYVENVVWHNYTKSHAFLFEDGNVEGELSNDVLEDLSVEAQPADAGDNMTILLKWAHDKLDEALLPR